MCGEVQWSSLGRNNPAAVGFNSEGNFFYNHPLSGLSGVGDVVSCTFDVGKRRKRQGDMTPNNLMMELDADTEVKGAVEECNGAFAQDEASYLLNSDKSPQTLAEMLEPCPCTLEQAIIDSARFVKLEEPGNCYVSALPINERLDSLGDISLTQMCCYHDDG